MQSVSGKVPSVMIAWGTQRFVAPVKNIIIFKAFPLSAGTDKLIITWDITSIILDHNGGTNPSWSKVFNGHLHFQLTVTFHQETSYLPLLQ